MKSIIDFGIRVLAGDRRLMLPAESVIVSLGLKMVITWPEVFLVCEKSPSSQWS
jgi:hypothetical protein